MAQGGAFPGEGNECLIPQSSPDWIICYGL